MRISPALKTDPLPIPADPSVRWFGAGACVETRDEVSRVFVGGTLIGSFTEGDTAARNALLVGLAEDPHVHLGHLAEAFDITSETLRLLRRLHESEGLLPVLKRTRGGSDSKVTPALRRRLEKMFAAGSSISEAHAALPRGTTLCRSTVAGVRKVWARRQAAPESTPSSATEDMRQQELGLETRADATSTASVTSPADTGLEAQEAPALEDEVDAEGDRAPLSATSVQHLGTWLMLGMVQGMNLHEHALASAGDRVARSSVRLALDAVVMALALGEPCVEGVRRLATPSAASLLLAAGAPSPSWTRRVLGRVADRGGAESLHLGMAREYLELARLTASGPGPVFYVDNHMRPYAGKHTLRKGWRMQDKRAKPGVSDYYVHDEDGRPVWRLTAPAHGSLTEFLAPIIRQLRLALPNETLLIAFDRAGAFPAQMAELREEGVEFVTYERKPYPTFPSTYFTESFVLDGEHVHVDDSMTNLGKGRGRVRRIALRMDDGPQVNLLTHSRRPARELVEIMRGRWNQENAFKHGVERWGINQLDSRLVSPYPPESMVPNPARRRLDRALRIARTTEGLARAELVRLEPNHPRCAKLERTIAEAVAEQQALEAQRPSTPMRARLKDTELAGKLVHHEPAYKMLLDSIRIACANAESDLAAELALHLPKPAEAKKTLANLLTAPGRIRVTPNVLTVTLEPAGTRREQRAFAAMLEQANQARLTLPADQKRRPLRFRVAQIS